MRPDVDWESIEPEGLDNPFHQLYFRDGYGAGVNADKRNPYIVGSLGFKYHQVGYTTGREVRRVGLESIGAR